MDGFKVYVEAINIFSHNNTTIPVTKISRRRGGGGGDSIAPTFGRYCFSVRDHNYS